MTEVRTVIKAKNRIHIWCGKLAILLWASAANSSVASTETFLPMQEITLGGKVVVPSCTVRLDTEHLRFDKSGSSESTSQRQNLIISECDIDGLGVKFQAETWPDYPARGVLKDKDTNRPSAAWHYRVAPAAQEEPEAGTSWPLSAASDARDLETDTPNPGSNPRGQYFSLDQVNYWYDLKRSPQGGESMTIPFLISVHRSLSGDEEPGDLQAVFSLQLTYR
ncbi:hypothetical protein [Pseudomonas canadensis]|uniref:hypothetical protein n=1 Tax=Pseudomonas canadensis TaxID=915099 RepID=UPI003B9E3BA4